MEKKKQRKKKADYDFAVTAFRVVQEATGQSTQQSEAGRLGGLKGGKARAAKLTPERRREIARNAAQKRWGKPAPHPQ